MKSRGAKTTKQDLMPSYLMFGIRSSMPPSPAMMLLWEIMTPLGRLVEPLVYIMAAMSEGPGCLWSHVTVDRVILVGEEMHHKPTAVIRVPSILLLEDVCSLKKTIAGNQASTIPQKNIFSVN